MPRSQRQRPRLTDWGRILRQLALAICAGVLSAYGQPGSDALPLFVLGLSAFAFMAARAESYWSALGVGLAFGASAFWIMTIGSIGWGPIVPVALTLIATLIYGVPYALLAHWVGRRQLGFGRFVASACVWTLCTQFGFLVGFPVQCEAVGTVVAMPFLLGGVRLFGVPVWCGLFAAGTIGAGVRLARSPSVRASAAAARPLLASITLLLGAALVARLTAPAAQSSITAGVPQLNTPSEYFHEREALPARREELEATFARELDELADVDLLALTETFDGAFPLLVPSSRQRFQRRAKLQHQALLLTSYLVAPNGGGYNAVGVIDADGNLVGVHRKVDLAPFGEVELEAGPAYHAFPTLPGVRVGILICQEALLTHGPRTLVKQGANLIVVPVSDASFGSSMFTFGHLAGARLTAIEFGRALIWASEAGPSGAIDRWGRFQAGAPFREAGAARVAVDIHADTTLYARTYWLWPVLAVLGSFWLVRTAAPADASEGKRRPIRAVRGLLELIGATALAVIASVAFSGLVELVHGSPARATRSMRELFGGGGPDLGPASLAPFATDSAHSANGALAYYLDFYGVHVSPTAVGLPSGATLIDAAHALAEQFGFPSREIELDFAALPRTGTLVVTRTGELGFLTTNRLGVGVLFLPTQGAATLITNAQARELLGKHALLPAFDPALEP